MSCDATDAAYGLLGLSAQTPPTPPPPPPIVPQKRKQEHEHDHHHDHHDHPSPPPEETSFSSTVSEGIDCICGFAFDDGFSIGCDECARWCHCACFGIVKDAVPDKWTCWVCAPRPVDHVSARMLQESRLRAAAQEMDRKNQTARRLSPGVERKPRHGQRASASAMDGGKRRRRTSINVHPQQQPQPQQPTSLMLPPGAEDETVDVEAPWTHSYTPIAKDVVPEQQMRQKLTKLGHYWRGVTALSPVHLPENTPAVPTSISPVPYNSIPSELLGHSNPSVRPPTYALHTAAPVPSDRFITTYSSMVTPSATYLADPLNAYAHLGMPKPFVHLMGPPLDVALDARQAGNEARYARSGCHPNAVLRPVICPSSRESHKPSDSNSDTALHFGVFATRDLKANEEVVLGWEWDDSNAIHSLPALIQNPNLFPTVPLTPPSPREVELLRHQMSGILHTLTSTFTTCACGNRAKDCAVAQMASFVDDLPKVTPAEEEAHDLGPLVGVHRGFRTREKVPFSSGMSGVEMDVDEDAAVDVELESPPVSGPSRIRRQVAQASDVASAFRASAVEEQTPPRKTVLPMLTVTSPTPVARSKKGKERAVGERPGEYGDSASSGEDSPSEVRSGQHKGKGRKRSPREIIVDSPSQMSPSSLLDVPEEAMETDLQDPEEVQMPIKMRKNWLHKSQEAFSAHDRERPAPLAGIANDGDVHGRATELDQRMDVDKPPPGSNMPPPPMPASLDPTTVSSTDLAKPPLPPPSHQLSHFAPDLQSPSASFANLSLLSPLFRPSPGANGAYPFPPERKSASPPTPVPPSSLAQTRMLSPRPLRADISQPLREQELSSGFAEPEPAVQDESATSAQGEPVAFVHDEPAPTPLDGTAAPQAGAPLSPQQLATLPAFGRTPADSSEEPMVGLEQRMDGLEQEPTQASSFLGVEPTPPPVPTVAHDPNALEEAREPAIVPPPPPTPRPPTPPRAATPPPPKHKMPLKDFLQRMKKQKEEGELAKVTSPVVADAVPQSVTAGHSDQQEMHDSERNGHAVDGSAANGCGVDGEVRRTDGRAEESTNTAGHTVTNGAMEEKQAHANGGDQPTVSPPAEGHQEDQALRSPPPSDIPSSLKASEELTQPLVNGNSMEVDHKPPAMADGDPGHHVGPQPKIEAIDQPIPSAMRSGRDQHQEFRSSTPEPPPPPLNGDDDSIRSSFSPSFSQSGSRTPPRQPPQEDGEIVPSPHQGAKQQAVWPSPSRSPPRQPRAHYYAYGAGSPSYSSAAPQRPHHQNGAYRGQTPLQYDRPVPSGPRALRGAFAGPAHSNQQLPRGPSAERGRWERGQDRGWGGRGWGHNGGGYGR